MDTQTSAFQFSLKAVFSLITTICISLWFFTVKTSEQGFLGYVLLYIGISFICHLAFMLVQMFRFRSAIKASGTVVRVDHKDVSDGDEFQPTVEYKVEEVGFQFKGPWGIKEYEVGEVVPIEYLPERHEAAQLRSVIRTRDIVAPLVLIVVVIGGAISLLRMN